MPENSSQYPLSPRSPQGNWRAPAGRDSLGQVQASENPAAYEPNLAIMLGNFSVVLHDLQWSEEALAIAEEAARIFRKLARENPDAFGLELLSPLSNLCTSLA